MNRTAYVVWGMHRSGTSAITRVLSLCGAGLPIDLMPSQNDNPTGFWESVGVVGLNDDLLDRMGRSWADPRPPAIRLPEDQVDRAIEDVRKLIATHWPAEGPIVLKDPRISLLGDIWIPALTRAGFDPHLLLALRHPDEVAASLNARNGFTREYSRLLWLRYTLDAWRHGGHPRTIVRYDALLSNWRSVFAEIAEKTGAELTVDGARAMKIDAFLSPRLRHHKVGAAETGGTDTDLVDRVYAALDRSTDNAISLADEYALQDESWRLFGTLMEGTVYKEMEVSRPDDANAIASSQTARARPIILHYHLFKNAGTSLDRTLQANFGATWDGYEGPGQPDHLGAYISERPWISALSSHSALLPPPNLAGIDAVPVIFIRHPLDRMRSAYDFERNQPAQTDGARAAKAMDISGYIRWRLGRRSDRAIANFQTHRLARGGKGGDELGRALDALETLPFVGLVEAYDESLRRLQALLSPRFPKLRLAALQANVTKKTHAPLQLHLDQLRERIGDDLYAEIEAANQSDITVWRKVCEAYQVDAI